MSEKYQFTEEQLDKAKSAAVNYTARLYSPEELDENIKTAKYCLSDEHYDHDTWSEQLRDLERLKNDPDYFAGKYPQSLDVIIGDIIDLRSFLHAILNVSFERTPQLDSYFVFSRMKVSMIYALVCKFGKLVSNQKNDVSLRNYWGQFGKYLTTIYPISDFEKIDNELKTRFTKNNSQVTYFRNKVVAHNEETSSLSLEEFDKDFRFALTLWSDLTRWSSFGFAQPWSDEKYVFEGMQHFCSSVELGEMKQLRRQYIQDVVQWSKITITGEKAERSPFVTLDSIRVSVQTQ